MLESITLRFTDSPTLTLPADGITVFVGPNNSGKSLVLREVELAMSVYPFPAGLRIVEDYEVRWQTRESIDEFIEKARGEENPNIGEGNVTIVRINPDGTAENKQLNLNDLYAITDAKTDKRWYATQFLKYGVIRLDGRSRFNLTNDQIMGDLLKPANNLIGKLFRDEATRQSARSYIKDAFGLNLVIDPTNSGNLRFRLSFDSMLGDEQSLNEAAREFHRRATYIKDASALSQS